VNIQLIRHRLMALTLFAVGCSSGADLTNPDPAPDVPAMILTEPMALAGPIPGPSSGHFARSVAPQEVVYVSLVAGSVPNGAEARVYNRTTGQMEVRPMIEGGLDPVAIGGSVGDSVEVTTSDRQGAIRLFGGVVQMRRRPEVVRTGPTRGQRDISLNSLVIVVFSEPINRSTVTGLTVRVLRAGQAIDATISLGTDGIQAELKPSQPLAPATTYAIVVTTSVADLAGDHPEHEFRSEFQTAATPANPVVRIVISPSDTTAAAGDVVSFSAVAHDLQEREVLTRKQWSSSDTAVARVTESGDVYAVSSGSAEIRASVQGVSASAQVRFTSTAFVAISAGGQHSCALAADGRALCWGASDWYQGGLSAVPRLHPVTAAPGPYRRLEAGRRHTCALTPEGSAECWGSNEVGQLGIGSRGGGPRGQVVGGLTFQELTAGGTRTCGLDRGGLALCWGQYTEPSGWLQIYGPEPLQGAITFAMISSGLDHDCAVSTSGFGYCWGELNTFGQLGNGTTTPLDFISRDTVRIIPEQIAGQLTFTALDAGSNHTCGISNGSTYCWGANAYGELGTNAPLAVCNPPTRAPEIPCSLAPVRAELPEALVSVTAGDGFTCGLTAEGTGYCWGRNEWGQLGNGGFTNPPAATPVAGSLRFESLSAGGSHTCGRTVDGAVYCWGRGTQGQLGNGSTASSAVPVRVALQGP
jgi:alpha-tubulin suppressor-like RCC1 family protein